MEKKNVCLRSAFEWNTRLTRSKTLFRCILISIILKTLNHISLNDLSSLFVKYIIRANRRILYHCSEAGGDGTVLSEIPGAVGTQLGNI